MDRPLLALTRPPGRAPDGPSPAMTTAQNMRQLVQLRWIAVAGQLATILVSQFALGVDLPLAPMLATLAALALANVAIDRVNHRRGSTETGLMLALLLDVATLAVQLDLSGGATNPFTSLFLIQVVLGAILLGPRRAWVIVLAAGAARALLGVHYTPLVLPPALGAQAGALYLLGDWLGFLLAAVLLLLFIARISGNLRARAAYLADLRRHASEEEAIVRMGLFATGAAHALGSPLGTLSVILDDWQRLPAVVGHPGLLGELDEMQAEVARCKRIVSDILRLAGQPREEAMEAARAGAFLDEAVAAWRPTHPQVPLDYRRSGLDHERLIADPALLQAIWNLLDNAAEACPAGVALTAERDVDGAVIAVLDRGPGFDAAALEAVGHPARSAKGEGHGVGLFLAGTVARRLGGRLEAVNRAGGGARVRLVVPLARAAPRGGGA